MRTFVIEPLRGIRGGVQFGMTREEARAFLAPERAGPFTRGGPVDAFYGASLQLSYDVKERVEFIEFARDERHRVVFEQFHVFGAQAMSVVEFLKERHQLSADDREPGCSFCFPSIELGLWRPFLPEEASEEGRYFETVGFGRAGYFGRKG